MPRQHGNDASDYADIRRAARALGSIKDDRLRYFLEQLIEIIAEVGCFTNPATVADSDKNDARTEPAHIVRRAKSR